MNAENSDAPVAPNGKDLTGLVFGKWTVLRRGELVRYAGGGVKRYWVCRCTCLIEKAVLSGSLTGGGSKSCKRCKHTGGDGRTKHRLHGVWAGMIKRCRDATDKYFKYYGGKNPPITVCERWLVFANFAEDMFPTFVEGLTLDRKENSLGYCKDNCRWATRAQQIDNRDMSLCITYNGETMNGTQWAKRLGFHPDVFRGRIKLGWSIERIIATPVKRSTNPNGRGPAFTLTHDGKTLGAKQWAEITGLQHDTIRRRIKLGLPAEQVLKGCFHDDSTMPTTAC